MYLYFISTIANISSVSETSFFIVLRMKFYKAWEKIGFDREKQAKHSVRGRSVSDRQFEQKLKLKKSRNCS